MYLDVCDSSVVQIFFYNSYHVFSVYIHNIITVYFILQKPDYECNIFMPVSE